MAVKISGFYDEITSDLKGQIAVMKELGESYMCPRVIDGKNIADYTLEEFKEKVYPVLQENGIRFSSIGSPIGKTQLADEAGFKKQLGQLAELVKICQLMECKYIRTFSFFMNDVKDIPSAFPTVVERIKEFVKLVEGADVILLHENEKHIYGDVPERALQVYQAINHPNYKMCYDASNYVQCDCDPQQAYQMTKEFTVYYHVKDCGPYKVEVPVGTGLGKYDELFSDLGKRGYDGFFTMEPHTLKYAIAKPLVYFVPFAMFFAWNFYKAFRRIDKDMKVGYFRKVSRKEVFLWQYNRLKDYINKYNLN